MPHSNPIRRVLCVVLSLMMGATLVALSSPAAAQSDGRIVGGTPATLGEIPHQVFFSFPGVDAYCGGALIRPDVVMTAGHCEPFVGDTVHAGLLNRSSAGDAQQRVVEATVVHPGFGETYDFAVVFLDEPFELSATLNTIDIATPAEFAAATEGRTSGWGNTMFATEDVSSDALLKTTLELHDDAFCSDALAMTPDVVFEVEAAIAAELFPEVPTEEILEFLEEVLGIPNPLAYTPATDFCAGGDGVTDACQGDSGGPFDVQRGDGTWVLAGVTSRGFLCAVPGSPGVWAEVPAVTDWVEETIAARNADTPDDEPEEPTPPPVETPDAPEAEAPEAVVVSPAARVPASSLTTGHIVVADTNGWEPRKVTLPAKAAPLATHSGELAYTGSNFQLDLLQWGLFALALGGLLLSSPPMRRRRGD